MSANTPVDSSVERSDAAEGGARVDASAVSLDQTRTTRTGRVLTALVGAGVLLAGIGSAAFAVGAVLELGALVRDVMALVSQPEPAVMPPHAEHEASPRRAAPSAAPDSGPMVDAAVTHESASLALNVATAPAREDLEDALVRQKVASALDEAAEASEKTVPLSVAPAPPLARVECPEVFVYIVSVVEPDAKLSVASLGIGHDGPARLRHVGDRIGDWEVAAITDDWSGLKPEVWLVRRDTYCRARLAGNPSRVHSPTRTPPAARSRKATPPARKETPPIEAMAAPTEVAPPAEMVAPPTEMVTPPTETAVGPAKKAKKSKGRRRRRRRR